MSTPESTRYPCNPWELDSKEPRAKIAKHYEATIHTAYRGETIKHITGHTILLFHELYEHCLDSKETVYTQLDCPIDSSATNQGDPRMVTVTQNQHTRWSSAKVLSQNENVVGSEDPDGPLCQPFTSKQLRFAITMLDT